MCHPNTRLCDIFLRRSMFEVWNDPSQTLFFMVGGDGVIWSEELQLGCCCLTACSPHIDVFFFLQVIFLNSQSCHYWLSIYVQQTLWIVSHKTITNFQTRKFKRMCSGLNTILATLFSNNLWIFQNRDFCKTRLTRGTHFLISSMLSHIRIHEMYLWYFKSKWV